MSIHACVKKEPCTIHAATAHCILGSTGSNNHHGFVGVSSSLELDGAEGVRGAELRVLADGPFLR